MTPWIIAGSVAAVAAIGVGILWRKRRRRVPAIVTCEDALRHAEQAVPGFVALGAAVGTDDRAALIAGEGGRVAVLTLRGDRVAVREVRWSAIRATAAGMLVETGGARLGRIAVIGVDALDVRRMAPQPTR